MPASTIRCAASRTLLSLAAAAALATSAQAAEPLKVGFMYIGPASGAGWRAALRCTAAAFGHRVAVGVVGKGPWPMGSVDGARRLGWS